MYKKSLAVFAIAAFSAMAQSPLPLKSKQFFGGTGDQSARSLLVSPADGSVYLGGTEGELVRVAIPPVSATWSVQLRGGSYLGLAALGSLVYGAGTAQPPVCGASDGVGDIEPKGMLSRYAPSSGAVTSRR